MDLRAALQTHFGFAEFRPGQEAAVRAAVPAARVIYLEPDLDRALTS